jgi:hypothetical protein
MVDVLRCLTKMQRKFLRTQLLNYSSSLKKSADMLRIPQQGAPSRFIIGKDYARFVTFPEILKHEIGK